MSMTARFQRSRWSPLRKSIDALQVGQSIIEPAESRDAIKTNIQRLQDAYGTRRYATKGITYRKKNQRGPITVTRTA